ncbi:GNAT family N-acetyltransferase [Kitasatospora purpeofusca]|uniref:GNAT family N-acetyltransferase n=1 Tax=Kitasatospora purpeofusca TaxID=67352 RepID=UPI002A5AE70F|nr:GNAT family N-acetyltransferase [Kitasatospora purpeofusca]MDY0815212.1 GNAT family N-acetyltransferase [Kitasatospora purpeofusca]
MDAPALRLEPWTDADLGLLRLINTPEMRRHVGGPESEERMLVRHRRYLDFVPAGIGCMYRVVLETDGPETGRVGSGGAGPDGVGSGGVGSGGVDVGSVGYAERAWQGGTVYEMGWNVLAPYRGRGIAATAARAAVEAAARTARHRHLHAFPSVDHPASNAVCRKAGFTLVGETDFEFPPGRWMRSNDWRVDLSALRGA